MPAALVESLTGNTVRFACGCRSYGTGSSQKGSEKSDEQYPEDSFCCGHNTLIRLLDSSRIGNTPIRLLDGYCFGLDMKHNLAMSEDLKPRIHFFACWLYSILRASSINKELNNTKLSNTIYCH
jgi:hypothetical protein